MRFTLRRVHLVPGERSLSFAYPQRPLADSLFLFSLCFCSVHRRPTLPFPSVFLSILSLRLPFYPSACLSLFPSFPSSFRPGAVFIVHRTVGFYSLSHPPHPHYQPSHECWEFYIPRKMLYFTYWIPDVEVSLPHRRIQDRQYGRQQGRIPPE